MKEGVQPSLEDDSINAIEEGYYGPKDTVLVMDTSYLGKLSNQDIWAFNVLLTLAQNIAEEGKQLNFVISRAVMAEYARMLSEKRPDNEYGLPLVHQPLIDTIESLELITLSAGYSAGEAALAAWKRHASTKFSPESNRVRRGPGYSDLSVIAAAYAIAKQRAKVYVASYDIRDIIDPLKVDAQLLSQEGLMVTPLGPSPVEIKAFNNTPWIDKNGKLRPVLNRGVVADLQVAKAGIGGHTYVIFERDVHSGDATFDVALGVEEFSNTREARVPEEYRKTGGKFYMLPALRIRSKSESGANGLMRSYFQRSNPNLPYRLLIFEEENPFFPILIAPSGKNNNYYQWTPALQTTMDFLSHQTDSAYAKAHFQPRSSRRT